MVPVTEQVVDLPSEWTVRTADERSTGSLAEYQLRSDEGTTFVVTVRRPTDAEEYGMQLSTIVHGETQQRHDYPVREYETRTAALDGAEAFIEHLSTRFQEGTLSRDDPTIEATKAAVEEFTDHRPFASIRRLARILRR